MNPFDQHIDSVEMANKTRSTWVVPGIFFFLTFSAAILLNLFHLPFIADDYKTLADIYLNRTQSPFDFGMLARAPLACLLTWFGITSGLWESFPGILFSISFSAHFMGLYLITRHIIERLSTTSMTKMGSTNFLLAATFIAALYSNNYEIHFWHGLTTHSLGVLIFALSLKQRSFITKPLLLVLPLLIYETFYLFYIGWALLEVSMFLSFKKNPKSDSIFKNSLVCVFLAILLAFGIRMGLKPFVNEAGRIPSMTFDLPQVLSNSKSVFRTLFLLHHYKASWPLTAVFWTWIFIFFFVLYKTSRRILVWTLILTSIAIASAIPLSIVNYNAQRSYYGPSLFFITAVAFGLSQLEWRKLLFLGMPLFAIFGFANAHIITVRIENQNRLNQVIAIASNTKPTICIEKDGLCYLSLAVPSKTLIPDWILPELMWVSFYEYELAKVFPGRQLHITIDPNL